MAKRKVSIPEQVDERYRAAVARAAVARAAKTARAAALAAGLPDPAGRHAGCDARWPRAMPCDCWDCSCARAGRGSSEALMRPL